MFQIPKARQLPRRRLNATEFKVAFRIFCNLLSPMKRLTLIWFLLSSSMLGTVCHGQTSYDEIRLRKAQQLSSVYGSPLNWTEFSLSELYGLESQAEIAKRVKGKHAIALDWTKLTTNELIDSEIRISKASNLNKQYSVSVDWKNFTLDQLLDVEKRIRISAHLKDTFGVDAPWENLSEFELSQLVTKLTYNGTPRKQRRFRTAYEEYLEQEATLKRSLDQFQRKDSSIASAAGIQPTLPSTLGGNKSSVTIPKVIPQSRNQFGNEGIDHSTKYPDYYNPFYRPPVGDHWVDSHYRSDGTYVNGHHRTDRDNSFWNNYSSKGNFNPYTGTIGQKTPPIYRYSGSTSVNGYFRSDGTHVKPHFRSR